jgi:hypothetical protein
MRMVHDQNLRTPSKSCECTSQYGDAVYVKELLRHILPEARANAGREHDRYGVLMQHRCAHDQTTQLFLAVRLGV